MALDNDDLRPAKKARSDHNQAISGPTSVTISTALKRAVHDGHMPSVDSNCGLFKKPVALMYDLDAWEGGLKACAGAFGTGYLHAIAVKSNGLAQLLQRAMEFGFGAECASIGEVLLAQSVGFPLHRIVFDSPCKTRAEIAWALRNGMHLNIDNFDELGRVVEIRNKMPVVSKSVIGLRINPLVGAGEIAALSVSTRDSKFGISSSRLDEILEAYTHYEWLNCLHVHTGSGGMALQTLVGGVKKAVEIALCINKRRPGQITVLDIGGGLPANYSSDDYGTEAVPTFQEYADALRQDIPELTVEFKQIVTEFGQALNAKSGWLASRVEYAKPIADGHGQIAVVHFGADMCPRQCYTNQHTRRIELYDGDTCLPKKGALIRQHIAGPLCFQGDMFTRDWESAKLEVDDFVVMRDTGANCLSLFSHHCNRQAPAVLGYTQNDSGISVRVLKPAQGFDPIAAFWGSKVSPELAQELEHEGK